MTSTEEFTRMQDLFSSMLNRIEEDFRNLKEYTENMAHEIQTPLAVVRTKLENLMGDEPVMDQYGTEIKILWDETNHLSKLSNTLNLFTKIENHEFENREDIFTEPVIEKHVTQLQEFVALKSLAITIDLSPDHTIHIDPFLLDILLKNLIWNAIRYAEPAGPIRIQTDNTQLVISNYGAPLDFPPEKLFERFYRKSESSEALGLGLALVKKICDLNRLAIHYHYSAGQHFFTISRGAPDQ